MWGAVDRMLMPVAVEAGMHLIAWLPSTINAEVIAKEALKEGLILSPLSNSSIKFSYPNGLILGFSGFSFAKMEAATLKLKQILAKYL
jgi:GntR family transcriptional regulator/MocR family aminotransferase